MKDIRALLLSSLGIPNPTDFDPFLTTSGTEFQDLLKFPANVVSIMHTANSQFPDCSMISSPTSRNVC